MTTVHSRPRIQGVSSTAPSMRTAGHAVTAPDLAPTLLGERTGTESRERPGSESRHIRACKGKGTLPRLPRVHGRLGLQVWLGQRQLCLESGAPACSCPQEHRGTRLQLQVGRLLPCQFGKGPYPLVPSPHWHDGERHLAMPPCSLGWGLQVLAGLGLASGAGATLQRAPSVAPAPGADLEFSLSQPAT